MVEKHKQREVIINFVTQAHGLETTHDLHKIEILQTVDRKKLSFHFDQIEDVLIRDDAQEKPFLQLNFTSGDKILITDELIGFKPIPFQGFDINKLPKVVTTSDLVSVFEAAEEALSVGRMDEVDVLRQVFNSILMGGELVGFDLKNEKSWFANLISKIASA
jgi:adenosine/AMP kinase